MCTYSLFSNKMAIKIDRSLTSNLKYKQTNKKKQTIFDFKIFSRCEKRTKSVSAKLLAHLEFPIRRNLNFIEKRFLVYNTI